MAENRPAFDNFARALQYSAPCVTHSLQIERALAERVFVIRTGVWYNGKQERTCESKSISGPAAGIKEAALRYLNKILERKFDSGAAALQTKIRAIADAAVLDEIMDAALAADSIEELEEAIDRICRRTQ